MMVRNLTLSLIRLLAGLRALLHLSRKVTLLAIVLRR